VAHDIGKNRIFVEKELKKGPGFLARPFYALIRLKVVLGSSQGKYGQINLFSLY
jgi:hypothetical protein